MRIVLALSFAMLAGFAPAALADEPAAPQDASVVVAEEQADFELLTPIPDSEVAQVRGEGWGGWKGIRGLNGCVVTPATPQERLDALRNAAQNFLNNFLNGNIGNWVVNGNGSISYNLPPM